MDDKTISISISGDEEELISSQIAAGNYADETEMLNAAIAVLEHKTKVLQLRKLIAEGDADLAAGRVHEYATTDDFLKDIMAGEFAD